MNSQTPFVGPARTHNAFRRILIAFMTIVNNVRLPRFDELGNQTGEIHVPLDLADKTLWYRKLREQGIESTEKATTITFPRMYVDLTEFGPDLARQKPAQETIRQYDRLKNNLISTKMPAAWKGTLELGIVTTSNSDAQRIIERIASIFAPTFTVEINELPELSLKTDIPFTLTSCARSHSLDMDFQKITLKNYTMTFDVRFNIYGDVILQDTIRKVFINADAVDASQDFSFFQVVEEAVSDSPVDGSTTKIYYNQMDMEIPGQ